MVVYSYNQILVDKEQQEVGVVENFLEDLSSLVFKPNDTTRTNMALYDLLKNLDCIFAPEFFKRCLYFILWMSVGFDDSSRHSIPKNIPSV